jgi:hypothetical protein
VPRREPDFSTPPPGWLDEPLRAVLHDLAATTPGPIRYGCREDADGRWLWIKELHGYSGSGCSVRDVRELLSELGWLQDRASQV